MLILVAVTVSVALNGGLFKIAKDAAKGTQEEKDKELELSNGEIIDKWVNGVKWEETEDGITNGEVTIQIGDYIDYKANVEGYDDTNGWRVLGVENGEVLIVSSRNLGANYTLGGKDGYNNGVTRLNEQCEPFSHGEYGAGARSITVEDINKITGYNPEKTGNGDPYGKGQTDQYGNEVTYTLNAEGKVAYSSDTKSADTSVYTKFEHVDGRILGQEGVDSITVKSTYYWYYPNTLTTSSSGETKGIETSSPAYDMLFNNTSYGNGSYWLASPYEYASTGYVNCGLRHVNGGGVGSDFLWFSSKGPDSGSRCGVRAVFSLKSDIQLTPETTENGVTHWSLSNKQ